MKILIFDWMGSRDLIEGTQYTSGQEIEGTQEDLFRIAEEFYSTNFLNIMIARRTDDNQAILYVDKRPYRFQQR